MTLRRAMIVTSLLAASALPGAPLPAPRAQAQTPDPLALCEPSSRAFREGSWTRSNLSDLQELEQGTRTRCPALHKRISDRIAQIVQSASAGPAPRAERPVDQCAQPLWPMIRDAGIAVQIENYLNLLPDACSAERQEAAAVLADVRAGRGPRRQPAAEAPLRRTSGVGALTIGEARAGTLEPAASPDAPIYRDYRLELAAGQGVELGMTSEAFDTFLEFGRGEGEGFARLAANDDGGEGFNSLLRFVPTEAGAFTVRARSYGGHTAGPFTVTVRAADITPPPPARPLSAGRARAGVLAPGGARAFDDDNQLYDLYAFTARAGQRARISLAAQTGADGAPEFDTLLVLGRMQDGAFVTLASNDDYGDSTDSALQYLVLEDGEYLIRAQALSSRGAGEYELSLEFPPETPPPAPIALPRRANAIVHAGELVRGMPVIGNETYYQDFELAARAGRTYVVDLMSQEFDAYLEIGRMSAAGFEALAEDDDGGAGFNSRLEFTPPEAGRYIVRARSYAEGATGPFDLIVTERE